MHLILDPDLRVPRHLRLDTLPDADERDYGLCIYAGVLDEPGEPVIVDYDDDYKVCCCGTEGCYKWSDTEPDEFVCDHGVQVCPVRLKKKRCFVYHRGEDVKICYLVEQYPARSIDVWDYEFLKKLPDKFIPPLLKPSTRKGQIYVIALHPDLSLHRLKVGWTSNVFERIKTFRTTSPHLLLLGLFDAEHEGAEQAAQCCCDGQLGESEVFDVLDPFACLTRIELAVKQSNDTYLSISATTIDGRSDAGS